MNSEVILYKRKNSFVGLLGLFLAGICFFTVIIVVVYSLYNNQKIELDIFVFTIVLIIVGMFINRFTGYTKEILVSYNKEGFNVRGMDFIEWKQLKTWTLKTKEKIDYNPFSRQINYEIRNNLPFPLNLFISIYPKIRKNNLKLELVDKRIILFSEDEVKDMFKFLRFLHKNYKNKQKGKFKLW